VVDNNCAFTDVKVGAPGRIHDARVFRNSNLAQDGLQNTVMEHYHGDTQWSFCDKDRRKTSRIGIIRTRRREQIEKSGISAVTFSTWLDLPGIITPADIAHGFTKTRKPPHHKVQSKEEDDVSKCWPTEAVSP
jgi:hypothetical protein